AEATVALEQAASLARELADARRRAAAELKHKMEAEVKTQGTRSAFLAVRVAPSSGASGLAYEGLNLGPDGIDECEFHIAPNLGQPPMALAKIASGGELSRVMLALKRLAAQRRGVATMIFDEVDAGIGGAIAQVVGRKMKQLSRFHQILCVTHLAQIAAFADRHLTVEKEERRGSTRSRVAVLEPGDRIEEIA